MSLDANLRALERCAFVTCLRCLRLIEQHEEYQAGDER